MPGPTEFGHVDLVVIGAGPTGIAALFFAALEGMSAMGLEAGPMPLSDIHEYPAGLTLLSPAEHYEVAGIPLDCRSADEITREDLLSYYSRLIRFGDINVRCQHRCMGLRRQGDTVVVEVETPHGRGSWSARQVLVTTWFRRRRPPISWQRGGLPVISSIGEPSRLTGKRVTIVGGGISAYEQAMALMQLGHQVTVVARADPHRFFGSDAARALVEATESRLLSRAVVAAVGPDGITVASGDAWTETIPSDVVVACLGRELCPETMSMLVSAQVITRGDVASLEAALAGCGQRVAEESKWEVAARWPDFRRQLLQGVANVHLAGGGLHIGGAGAGIQFSILTSRLAVHSMKHGACPPSLDSPLPVALLRLATAPGLVAEVERWCDSVRGYRYELVAEVCPLAIRAWSRIGIRPPLAVEDATGALRSDGNEDGSDRYVLRGRDQLDGAAIGEIVRVADGIQSVRALARSVGLPPWALLRWMNGLWYRNGLSWLPPMGGLSNVERCSVLTGAVLGGSAQSSPA